MTQDYAKDESESTSLALKSDESIGPGTFRCYAFELISCRPDPFGTIWLIAFTTTNLLLLTPCLR